MAKSWKERFGDRLVLTLAQQGRKQRDLAAHFGIHESAVSLWTKGRSVPGLERFAEICRYLRVAPSKLLDLNFDEPEPKPLPPVPPGVQDGIGELREQHQAMGVRIDALVAQSRRKQQR